MEQIALIADIHGNIPALETVLSDIRRRGIRRIICLGDLVGKGPYSDKAVDICREECELTIRGNWDDFIHRDIDIPVMTWHRQRLGQERLDYLKSLPNKYDFYLSGRRVRLFHASQAGVDHRVHMWASDEDHLSMFTNTAFTGNFFTPDTVGYADIHMTYSKNMEGKVLFNTGSVGNPLDEPFAAYVILEGNYRDKKSGPFSLVIVRLPYDIELAVKQAKDEDMPELEPYADELRTAIFRGITPEQRKYQ
jgi:protein phosphatase